MQTALCCSSSHTPSLLDDLAAFEAGELLPYWFAEALDSPDPDPKFLARP